MIDADQNVLRSIPKRLSTRLLKVLISVTFPVPKLMTVPGRPVHDPTAQTVLRGSPLRGGGLALLADTQLIETLAHFPRERIPERYAVQEPHQSYH